MPPPPPSGMIASEDSGGPPTSQRDTAGRSLGSTEPAAALELPLSQLALSTPTSPHHEEDSKLAQTTKSDTQADYRFPDGSPPVRDRSALSQIPLGSVRPSRRASDTTEVLVANEDGRGEESALGETESQAAGRRSRPSSREPSEQERETESQQETEARQERSSVSATDGRTEIPGGDQKRSDRRERPGRRRSGADAPDFGEPGGQSLSLPTSTAGGKNSFGKTSSAPAPVVSEADIFFGNEDDEGRPPSFGARPSDPIRPGISFSDDSIFPSRDESARGGPEVPPLSRTGRTVPEESVRGGERGRPSTTTFASRSGATVDSYPEGAEQASNTFFGNLFRRRKQSRGETPLAGETSSHRRGEETLARLRSRRATSPIPGLEQARSRSPRMFVNHAARERYTTPLRGTNSVGAFYPSSPELVGPSSGSIPPSRHTTGHTNPYAPGAGATPANSKNSNGVPGKNFKTSNTGVLLNSALGRSSPPGGHDQTHLQVPLSSLPTGNPSTTSLLSGVGGLGGGGALPGGSHGIGPGGPATPRPKFRFSSFSSIMDYFELSWGLLAVHCVVFAATVGWALQDKQRERTQEEATASFFTASILSAQSDDTVSEYEEVFSTLSFVKILLRSACFTFAFLRFVGTKTREEKSVTERESWLGYFLSNAFTALWPASTRGALAMLLFALSRSLVENSFFVLSLLESRTPSKLEKRGSDSHVVCETFDACRSVFLKSIVLVGLYVGHRYITDEEERDDSQLSMEDELGSSMGGGGAEGGGPGFPGGASGDEDTVKATHMLGERNWAAVGGLGGSFVGASQSPGEAGVPDDQRRRGRTVAQTGDVSISPREKRVSLPREKQEHDNLTDDNALDHASLPTIAVRRASDRASTATADLEASTQEEQERRRLSRTSSNHSEIEYLNAGEPMFSAMEPRARFSAAQGGPPPTVSSSSQETAGGSPGTGVINHGRRLSEGLDVPSGQHQHVERKERSTKSPDEISSPSSEVFQQDEHRGSRGGPGAPPGEGQRSRSASSPHVSSPSDPPSEEEAFPDPLLASTDEVVAGLNDKHLLNKTWPRGAGNPLLAGEQTGSASGRGGKNVGMPDFGGGGVVPEGRASVAGVPIPSGSPLLLPADHVQLHHSQSASGVIRSEPAIFKEDSSKTPGRSGGGVFGFGSSSGSSASFLSGVAGGTPTGAQESGGSQTVGGAATPAAFGGTSFFSSPTSINGGSGAVPPAEDEGRNWFLLQPRKPWQPRQLWRKLRFCVFGLDPFSQSLNTYAVNFAAFVSFCSLFECLTDIFIWRTVSLEIWVGRRLITGNWRHAIYFLFLHPYWAGGLLVVFRLLRGFWLKSDSPHSKILQQLFRGLLCFGLILMSHRVCSGLLSFFITFECKHVSRSIQSLCDRWRHLTRKQRQARYWHITQTVQRLDRKLFLLIHFVFCEHIFYIILDIIDANCATFRYKNLPMYMMRHTIGIVLACVALWHVGVVNYNVYEGVWGKVQRERLHLRDDQVLYRRELKDWDAYLSHGSRFSRTFCIRLFWMRYALTSNIVVVWIVSLMLWPLVAKTVLNI